MAGSVSLRLLLPAPLHAQTLTLTLTPPFSPYTKPQNPSFLGFRKPRPTKSQQNLKTKKNRSPKPINLPFLSPFSRFLDRIKGDGIGLEILSIALPAVLALAADPIASLVDTAFVGHLGMGIWSIVVNFLIWSSSCLLLQRVVFSYLNIEFCFFFFWK